MNALQQAKASVNELTVAVKNNTDNAREADRLATVATGVAERGGEAVRGVVRTIADISTLSAKIADISGVIDQIAFQTNLLSLDAAVEAARVRFRPLVMTSMAFVLGVIPLVLASGAGAGARRSMGTGVFGGMLLDTFVATLFIPLFFKILTGDRKEPRA